jgi:NAD(P)-dependent dehydrogenase (short-subunit alcohol dehydrogenase family)
MKLLGKKASVTGSVRGIGQAVGINVNNVAPGAIDMLTNTKLLNDPDTFNALLENIPLARPVWRSDVAFRTYNTGATINADGDLTWKYNEQ